MVDETEVYISAGVGISLFPRDADTVASLIRNAEAAMFEAKRTGGAAYVLSAGPEADSSARLHFVTRLRKAVDAQRWTLYYQPVVDLQDGGMVGVEALIRWIEPDGTMIPPNDFIPLAEELGLIERIGDWVVRELTFQVAAWRELDIDLEVGFNLSPRQFWQPDLARRIQHEFRSGGVDPSRVMVEVTETSAMMDPDRAQGILHELTDAGFAIAIDDFGTGYSSLSRLRHMPVRVLKIDRSFVSNVHTDRQAASIVSAFLELADGLDLITLAEGIETEEELAFLREKGCRLGQGFLFSKPVPPEEIIAYVFGGIPSAAALRSATRPRDSRAAAAIDAASIPAHARSSVGVADPAICVTPSFRTRPDRGPVAASASSTASPRPPSTRWSSTTTTRPVSSRPERSAAASIGLTL
jgi:EAL domain-containing protein (putative c-di-GMP-specific phosphodiesterase class I)